ncbi:MAG: serine/threonine-protein kinase [candidate division WOR-3 bacterium]
MKIGKYEIVSELKKDNFTEVYKVYNKSLNRYCLIKLISKDFPEDLVLRFNEEAKTCASIDHPYAVKIYEIFEKDNKIIVVYEWVDGYDLSKLIEISEKIDPEVALIITYKVLEVLDYIHKKGIIHRDIKPSNILISKEGFVKLTDFGIAKAKDSPEITQPGVVIGTPFYMSPEQVKGEKLYPSSDIFSLGCTLYEMITGKKAFTGKDTTQILIKIERENPDFSRKIFKGVKNNIKKILKKSLYKNPEKRYKSASEFKKDILKIVGERKILEGDKIIRDYIEEKIKIFETKTLKGLKKKKEEKKEKGLTKILIPLFTGLFLIFLISSFYFYKKFFYPYLEIKSTFDVKICKINNELVLLPFKGSVPPGKVEIKVLAPFYLYRGIFYLKLREKKVIEIPFKEGDSTSFHFRGKGKIFVNKNLVGSDSIDYKIKPGIPYLFEIKGKKDTVKEYLSSLKKDVIWIYMP